VLVKELKAAKFAAEAEQRERLAKAAIRKAKLHVQEQQRLARQAAEKARMDGKKTGTGSGCTASINANAARGKTKRRSAKIETNRGGPTSRKSHKR